MANFYKTFDLQNLIPSKFCLSEKLNCCKPPSLKVANVNTWQNLSNIRVSLTYESNLSIEDITIGYSVFFNSYSLPLLLNPSLYNLYSIRPQDQVVAQTNNFTISVFTLRMKLRPGNQRGCSPLSKWKLPSTSLPKSKMF